LYCRRRARSRAPRLRGIVIDPDREKRLGGPSAWRFPEASRYARDRRCSIDHCVVDLEIEREPAIGKAFDELCLEHRPVAIEQLLMRASHVREKLGLRRTARQYRVLD